LSDLDAVSLRRLPDDLTRLLAPSGVSVEDQNGGTDLGWHGLLLDWAHSAQVRDRISSLDVIAASVSFRIRVEVDAARGWLLAPEVSGASGELGVLEQVGEEGNSRLEPAA